MYALNNIDPHTKNIRYCHLSCTYYKLQNLGCLNFFQIGELPRGNIMKHCVQHSSGVEL